MLSQLPTNQKLFLRGAIVHCESMVFCPYNQTISNFYRKLL
ncbi:hypothetical protein SAMN02982996_02831 [Lonsdalea quercina]|uniref:Uncharacterized protein n=1 Tax=Lonsdalea quercina TaxID=71657 RepID=A0A1H4EZJ7_9GAMM|nr:hypothetical protein SAMN02982996_02831 [Lonsdalea quercina]